MITTIKKRIYLYYVLKFGDSCFFSFMSTTYVLFLLSIGLNKADAGIINGFCFFAGFLFELPTGALADSIGRKRTYVLANFFMGLGMLIYASATNMLIAIVAEITAALGMALASGCLKAWITTELHELQADENLIDQSIVTAAIMTRIGSLFGALIGAIIAYYSDLGMPWFWGGICLMIFCLIVLIIMPENTMFLQPKTKQSFSLTALHKQGCDTLRKIKQNVRNGLHYTRNNKYILIIIMYACLFSYAITVANMQWAVLADDHAFNDLERGYLFIGVNLLIIGGSWLARHTLRKQKSDRALTLGFVIVGIGMIFTPIPSTTGFLTFFLLHEFGRGLSAPLMHMYLNRHIHNDEIRSTVISVFETFARGAMGLGLVINGFFVEYVSMTWAWILAGLIILVAAYIVYKANGHANQ